MKFHEICDNDLPHPLSIEERLKQRRREFAQIDEGKRVAYFAEIGGEVVGCVQLRLDNATPDEGLVHALIVHRNYRRIGAGSRLMDAVEAEAVRRGYRRVWLSVHSSNEAARCFYRNNNYTEVGDEVSADGDRMIEMEKETQLAEK